LKTKKGGAENQIEDIATKDENFSKKGIVTLEKHEKSFLQEILGNTF
jgi:hypothetical protein